MRNWLLAVLTAGLVMPMFAADKPAARIEKNTHVYIEPMGGFETYLSAAFLKKGVPLIITDDKTKADYIITGTSHTEKAGWAKTLFVTPAPQSDASISMKSAKTGEVVFAYAVDKFAARHADQSTAEACAKHLKNAIDKQ